MKNKYDVIIIGGGHNGLIAATVLARNNKSVLVLEKKNVLGGIAAGEEFYPGYKTSGLLHDCSTVRMKVIKELKLEEEGLTIRNSRPTVALLSKKGECLMLHPDAEQSAIEISKFSSKDAHAYKDYREFIDKISGFINRLTNEAPPDLMNLGSKEIWALAKKGFALKNLGKKTMMEFLKVAPMSVADFLNEKFETDFIKAGIAGPAIYGSFTGPWSSYNTLNLLIWECTANETIPGGPQALISSLQKVATKAGVDIEMDSNVKSIQLDESQMVIGVKLPNGVEILADTVASSCTPQETFLNLLRPNQISYSLEQGVTHYRSRGTTAKINLAVNSSISFNGVDSIGYARTGNSFDEMERAFDSVKYREFSKEPILDIHIPSLDNPELAPVGHSVVSIIVHFVPHQLEAGWSAETKNELLDNTLKTLEVYSPGLTKHVKGSEVLSPMDLEQRYSLTNGHIFHGEHAIDQLITRPLPSCANYQTPIKGLFLCGSGSHPGGGITCMPGYLAAKKILQGY